MINMLTFEVDYLALTQSLCVLRLAVVLATCYTYYINQKTSWEATMVMNEFGETGEGHGVDVLDVVVEGHSHACRGRCL